jgi:hypothetical protein
MKAHEMQQAGAMQSFGRVEYALGRLRRERDRISPTSRACVEQYLDDVEPCLDALEAATNLCEPDVFDEVAESIAESIASLGDEIATIVTERADEDMLPEIIELARVEREGLAEDVRAIRGLVSSRARIALDALAVSLTSVRLHHGRRAA